MSLLQMLKFIIYHPLNRANKNAAIMRFIKWQIASRLITGEVIVNWINDTKFIVRSGETGLTGNIYCGLHEFTDMAFLLHILNKEDLFVDVGANVGSYTLLSAGVKKARAYAFEPVPSTFSRLVANIRLNNLESRVNCLNVAVADKEVELNFTSDEDSTNHVLLEGDKENMINVEGVTLDKVFKDDVPQVLKIDVEGFEFPVLQGGQDILRHPSLHSIIIELNGSGNRYGFDESIIVEQMNSLGFLPYRYDPFDRELIEIKGKNYQSGNTLFVRNIEQVQQKLKTAEKIKIFASLL